MMSDVVILGCGKLGSRLATNFSGKGISPLSVSRTPHARLAKNGINFLQVDFDQALPAQLPLKKTVVYYFIPPQASGTSDRRISNFFKSIACTGLPKRIILISVTSIYGDCHGEWVTESREPAPNSDRARRRLDGEQQLLDWSSTNRVDYCILRVPGIYGPDRLPLERIKSTKPVISPEQAPYSNRIHEQDLLEICLRLYDHDSINTLYNISDDCPTTMTDYFFQIADKFKIARPPIIDLVDAPETMSAEMMHYVRESRRISNNKIKSSLNLTLRYPSLSHGLAAIKIA